MLKEQPQPIQEKMVRASLMYALLFALLATLGAGRAIAQPAPVFELQVADAIGPASADFILRGLARAEDEGAQLVVLSMDTPGGLDTSMRDIIKAILASPVPVATYVAPSGARAASAGTYILYASHVAAMAPGTNLGAATPVALGGVPGQPADKQPAPDQPAADPAKAQGADSTAKKQINDASAYIRSLAQLRQRNTEWAEQAVREAVSLSAEEALDLGVIDYIATDSQHLISQLDGKSITAAAGVVKLQTAGVTPSILVPDWRTRLLAVITNPSVALLLMMIGIYGLILEFSNPGSLVGGVLGGICLLLALYALQLLPVNYAGLALILLGIAFMAAEALLPSFGILGMGGVAALALGALILIDTDVPGLGIPLSLIISLALVSGVLVFATISLALRARKRRLASGDPTLIGCLAKIEAVDADDPRHGRLSLQGEHWQALSQTPLQAGTQVRVLERQGLQLRVAVTDANATRET
jgi:membrane-bound serine protease (ClpP class)